MRGLIRFITCSLTLYACTVVADDWNSVLASWKEVGRAGPGSTDRIFVDLDSIRQEGAYRTAFIITVYESPRLNAHNVRLDRHVQKTAFDCGSRTFAGISTVGYLAGKQVGKSSANADWHRSFKAITPDALSQQIYTLVCPLETVNRAEPYPASSCTPQPLPPSHDGDVGNTALQPGVCQAWQQRRLQFADVSRTLQKGDAAARRKFDAVLTEFETHPLARTPMENMEIIGAFYLPKDGIAKCLPVIALNAVLGWYDALRFASESGRVEISVNEGFFKKPFVVAGKTEADKAVNFFVENSEQTAALVAQGLALAERQRETQSYDRHWPSVYGLEHVQCGLGGPCGLPKPLPEDQWNAAWEQARQRVTAYYRASPESKPSGRLNQGTK